MEQRKKSINTFLAMILLCLTLFTAGVGIVYGYLNQAILRNYEVIIRATDVMFKFNDLNYLDEIQSDKINLYKGAKTDVMMNVSVVGSQRVVVGYDISFKSEIKGAHAKDLMAAIEVYRKMGTDQNPSREYICSLDKIDTAILSGFMVANYREDIPLEFVFSSAASDSYYEHIANKDVSFSVKATATAIISSESEKYAFASTTSEFKRAFASPDSVGKTIILTSGALAQDSIVVDEDITSQGIVGIDLNGIDLDLNGKKLTIDCNGYTTDADDNDFRSFERLGIVDSKGSGRIFANGGHISVENAAEVFLIDNRFDGNLNTGTIRLAASGGNNLAAIFEDFVSLIDTRTDRFNDGTIYRQGDELSFLFKNLYTYLNQVEYFKVSIIDPGESSITHIGNGVIRIVANPQETTRFWYGFSFSFYNSLLGYNTVRQVEGFLEIRGNSFRSIANALNAQIPHSISSSQFFKTYDSVTGAHIEWYVDDGMSGLLLDNSGLYRKNGLDAIISDLEPSYPDREVFIYIKVAKDNQGGGNYADEDDADNGLFAYRHTAVTVTIKERTALVFKNTPVIISAKDKEIFDIANGYLSDEYKDKVGLVSIKLENLQDENNYAEIKATGAALQFNTLGINEKVTIPQNSLTDIIFDIVFVYKISTVNEAGMIVDELREFRLKKLITIEGEHSEVTKYDMSYTLQIAFSSNDYTEGHSNSFFAYGALRPLVNGNSVAVLCDYTALGIPANYVSIRYMFIPVSDLGGGINEQLAYFIKNSEGAYEYIDEPQKYLDDNAALGMDLSDIYERKAVIEILYARISTVDEIIAYFSVCLYTLDHENGQFEDSSGNVVKGEPNYGHVDEVSGSIFECSPDVPGAFKIYKDPTTGTLRGLEYRVSLQIIGIIRNNLSQVADLQLFNVYLGIFDADKNGVLTNKEAEDWEGVKSRYNENRSAFPRIKTYTSLIDGNEYYYIDLYGLKITSLKGVEYFKGVEGYNFDSTGRTSLSALAPLYNLVYLSFRSNFITDLSPLQYLDNLEYLDLYDNRITKIDPLRHLPRMAELSIGSSQTSGFNTVSNYEPLTLMTNLKVLDFRGMRTTNGTGLHADGTTMYYFALLTINCGDVDFYYDFDIDISPELMVAAKVLRDLENINRVNKTLYMPTYYYYENASAGGVVTQYQLRWFVEKDEKNLELFYVDDDPISNPVVKYKISSPIQDKPVKLYLQVYENMGSTVTFKISREFNLTLEASYTGEKAYIYDYLGKTYILAEDAIPDERLRARLFELFNHDLSTNPVNGFTTSSELNVISKEDMDYFYNNYVSVHDLSYRGIENLSGIEYFYRVFRNGNLVLSGNPFPSSELSKLSFTGSNNLTKLTLGGAKYEFTDLLNQDGQLIPASVVDLYVTECYGLDEKNVLESLYEVYLSKNGLNIYIENSTTKWDPYALTLPLILSKFKTVATFAKYGDNFDIYKSNGGTSSDGISFTVYGREYLMTLSTTTTLYYNALSQNMNNLASTTNYCYYSNGVVTYINSFGSEMTASARFQPQFSVVRGTTTSTVTFNYYYIQFIFTDGGDFIDVYEDGNTNKYLGSLSNLVSQYSLKADAYSRLYKYIDTNWNTSLKVTNRSLLAGSPASFSIDSEYVGSYVDYKGRIAVSSLIFGNDYAMAGLNSFFDVSLYDNNAAAKKEGALAGLQYFTGITDLEIDVDTDFGNGAGLRNIKTMNLYRMVVDFSKISEYANNLAEINLYYYYSFDAGTAENSAFKYFPNLQRFNIISPAPHRYFGSTTSITYRHWINDFSFLEGLVHPVYGTSSLTELTIYNLSGTGTAIAGASTMPTSDENAESIKKVYVASIKNGSLDEDMLYRVGSPTIQSAAGYFFAKYSGTGDINNPDSWDACYSETNSIDGVSEQWSVSSSGVLDKNGEYDFEYLAGPTYLARATTAQMKDMGLSYNENPLSTLDLANSTYWLDDEKRDKTVSWVDRYGANRSANETITTLKTGSALYLPASTFTTYYGLVYGEDEVTRDYRIQWDVFVVYNPGSTPSNALERTVKYNGLTGEIVTTATGLTTAYYQDEDGKDYKNYLKITFSGVYANAYVSVIATLIESEVVSVPYSFWYEFKIGNGDGIYTCNGSAGVRDPMLRMWLFANRISYMNVAPAAKLSINITTTNYRREIQRRYLYAPMGYDYVLPIENGNSVSVNSFGAVIYDQIKSIEGICDVFDHWGSTEKIISLTLRWGKFRDVAPLYRLTNLESLDLSAEGEALNENSYSPYYRSNVEIDDSIRTYGGTGAFLKLKLLNLNYCFSVTPDGLQSFSQTARRDLETLQLYNTRCMYSYDSVKYIKAIVENTTSGSIRLWLNHTSVDAAVTSAVVNNFLNDTKPSVDYPQGFNTESILYKNGMEEFTKNFAYTYLISTAALNLIQNYLVAPSLDIRLRITTTATNYRQFTNTHLPDNTLTFYNVSVTSHLRFGTTGLTAENFDTEVLAYMFLNHKDSFKQNGFGYHVYNGADGDITIMSPDTTGIPSPVFGLKKGTNDAAILLNASARTISLNKTYHTALYSLAYKEYKESIVSTVSLSHAAAAGIYNGDLTAPSTNSTTLFYLVSAAARATVNYVRHNQPGFAAEIPSSIYYKGQEIPIDWGVGNTPAQLNKRYIEFNGVAIDKQFALVDGNPIDDESLQAYYKLFYKDTQTQKLYFILNSTTLPANDLGEPADVYDHEFTIYARPTLDSTVISNAANPSKVIDFVIRDASITATYDEYIEAKQVGNEIRIHKNGNANDYHVIGTTAEIPTTPLFKTASDENFYNYNAPGTTSTTVMIKASYVLKSPWLVDYMFHNYFKKGIIAEDGNQRGTILSMSDIDKFEIFDIKYNNGTSSNANFARYISTIEGIQIFHNLKTFIARTGMFNDLSPLSKIGLETFYYSPISEYDLISFAPHVTDFSPLLGASKSTLKYFSYSGNGMAQMLDMSFLLGLDLLEEVYIASAYHYSYVLSNTNGEAYTNISNNNYFQRNALTYFMTTEGRYVMSDLASRGIYIYTILDTLNNFNALYYANGGNAAYDHKGNARSPLTVIYDKSRAQNHPNNIGGSSVVYAITASINEGFARDILSSYKSEINGVTYENRHIISVNTAAAGITVDSQNYAGANYNTSVTFDITSTIAQNGGFYIISWASAGANTVVNKYYLTKNLKIGAITYMQGQALTLSDLEIIANSIEYYSEYRAGLIQLRTSVTVHLENDLTTISNVRITGNITLNEQGYGRMFTFSFR